MGLAVETGWTSQDLALIEAAREIIRRRYRHGWHHVGAAVRARSGRVYAAVHLEAYVGRAAVCAEAVALGMAVAAGEEAVEAVVAVRHPAPGEPDREIRVVSPCGLCRELISDYSPDAAVLFTEGGLPRRAAVRELLPARYSRGREP